MPPIDRQELAQTLSRLPESYFDQIVFTLDVPSEILPTSKAAMGDRAMALLNWAEKSGPGLKTLQDVLNQVQGKEIATLPAICPYKGLSYFDCNDRDHHYFYGRQTLTQILLEKVEQGNFLAIVGASGSGKSSVLRAGVLQDIKNHSDTEIHILVPGEHPLQNLSLAFVDKNLSRIEQAELLQKIKNLIQKGDGLSSLIEIARTDRVLLVIDQFEEAFTLCQDKTERQTFFATLLGALAAVPKRLGVILAMRSDFVGKCFEDDYSGLATLVKNNLEPVLPMSQDELTQAIKEPARQTGCSLEPGLVAALLKDVDPASGSLPLLQYTLTELWENQQDNQLKLSTYMQLGGVTGALQQTADKVYNALTREQQLTAKHIFLSLTQLGEGSEDTRRRITQASLISAQHPGPQVIQVIKQLADANLVVSNDLTIDPTINNKQGIVASQNGRTATLDVAHEALIRTWPKLRQWLDENRDLLRQQRKIEQAAAEWSQQPKEQQPRYLLEGRQLSDARRFQKQHGEALPLSEEARKYLSKSLVRRRRGRIKLTVAGLVIPLMAASYAGVQAATYFRLRPHWDLIYAYDPANNPISNVPLTRALGEINDANRSLRRISLPSASLSNASLSNASLSNANLSNADLRNANLRNADLRYTDLRNADLRYTDLRNA
ncbi:pentapeptide repeat-containing protein, partial [Oscillatoria sp. CS-180]|uniref:nSTAND1 domain-containing NTPase n=1 Tax=Oscillatoria sp. CS-180 TaxID=3021720 RepID=UPI0023312407